MWRWRGVRLDADETHNHGIQVTAYVPSEWSGVTTFLCIPVRDRSWRRSVPPVPRPASRVPGAGAPRVAVAGAAMAPALLRGAPDPTRPREPDPPAPDAAPLRSATPQPPRAEPTPVTRHTTNADTFHIVHASPQWPAVHSLTRHHTPHVLMVTYAPWYLTISIAEQSVVDRTCCLNVAYSSP